MEKISFSVVICNYNYAGYVEEAIESALQQIPQPTEIIVVDDGSSDQSRALLDRRYLLNPVVRLLYKENGGQLSAFIAGVNVAQGNVIVFLDADDRWRSGYLRQLQSLYGSSADVDFVYGNLGFFGGLGEGFWFQPDEPSRSHGLTVLETWVLGRWRGAPTSALSLRVSLARRLLAIPETYWPDWRTRADDVLVYGAGVCGAKKYFLSEVVVDYRVHGSNSWLGSGFSHTQLLEYEFKKTRLITHFARDCGLVADNCSLVYREFVTKPQPSKSELLCYLRILWKCSSRLGVMRSLSNLAKILCHYQRTRSAPQKLVSRQEEANKFPRRI